MSTDHYLVCRQLQELIRLNRELFEVADQAATAACAEADQPAKGTPASLPIESLAEAVRVHQAIFSMLVRCVHLLGTSSAIADNSPPAG